MTDGQLLERFLSCRDEAAFAALLRRHGPMVWGVCRRALQRVEDAEDAFQATFLVLVRKGATVVPRERVANWLHGVARQTAVKARALASRRAACERQVPELPEPAAAGEGPWSDLRPLLDGELSRLPDRFRAVVVLCDLEGKTRREAAAALGVPEGTVAGWLSRARASLAARLTRRGVAPSGGALAVLLSRNGPAAGAPLGPVSSTLRAATLVAAGDAAAASAIPANVAALTEGVLRTMLVTRLKIAAAVLLLAFTGLGLCASRGAFATAKADGPASAEAAAPADVFPGKWGNVDKDTAGLRRVVIENKGDDWTVQAWGVRGDEEAELGKTRLRLLRDIDVSGGRGVAPGVAPVKCCFATISDKAADRHLTLQVEKGRLVVEVYTLFKDDRPCQRYRCELQKAD
jgi:RNA polymerase sigma factor (sigma-70 family)